jgi:hypothetical protein
VDVQERETGRGSVTHMPRPVFRYSCSRKELASRSLCVVEHRMRIGTISDPFELVFDLVERDLIRVVEQFHRIRLKIDFDFEDARDGLEFRRDRACARVSGHP